MAPWIFHRTWGISFLSLNGAMKTHTTKDYTGKENFLSKAPICGEKLSRGRGWTLVCVCIRKTLTRPLWPSICPAWVNHVVPARWTKVFILKKKRVAHLVAELYLFVSHVNGLPLFVRRCGKSLLSQSSGRWIRNLELSGKRFLHINWAFISELVLALCYIVTDSVFSSRQFRKHGRWILFDEGWIFILIRTSLFGINLNLTDLFAYALCKLST